jgi:long-subunit acyl-CoA synthetase (AMP-forming)
MSEVVRTFRMQSPLSVKLISYVQTFGAVMQPLPGTLNGKLQRIPGSAGVLVSGMEARTVREDGTEADANEIGELWLRGGNVSIGYWNNTKGTTETFVDGWLHTGDRFKIDEKGNFWCV